MSRRGRPPKTTETVKLELRPLAIRWLDDLVNLTCYGNSREDVAMNLLNEQFKKLLEGGKLQTQSEPSLAEEVAFPTPGRPAQTTLPSAQADGTQRKPITS